MARTLNELSDLKKTRYGWPPPRHGLIMLWWFAHECVRIEYDRMIARCNPENGAFGFHRFYNWDRLLPRINLPYYEVGNLNTTGSLPLYVTKFYTGYSDNSNKDRIIVCFDSRWNRFDSVYVTEHSDLKKFDQNHTYRISIELMKDIKNLSREEYLREPMKPSEHCTIDIINTAMPIAQTRPLHIPQPHIPQQHVPQQLVLQRHVPQRHVPQRHISQSVQSDTSCLSKKCRCGLICVLIVLLAIIAVGVFLWFKLK